MDYDFARLLDSKELMLSIVLVAQEGVGDTLLAKVVVRTIETLMTHTNDLLVADVADDVLVHRARCLRGVDDSWGFYSAPPVVGADLVILRKIQRDRHREEGVREVVLGPDLGIGEASRAEIVVYRQ